LRQAYCKFDQIISDENKKNTRTNHSGQVQSFPCIHIWSWYLIYSSVLVRRQCKYGLQPGLLDISTEREGGRQIIP
jgi:hypothetical protein